MQVGLGACKRLGQIENELLREKIARLRAWFFTISHQGHPGRNEMIGRKAFAHHAGLEPAKHLPRTTLVTYAAPAKSLRYDRTVRQHLT